MLVTIATQRVNETSLTELLHGTIYFLRLFKTENFYEFFLGEFFLLRQLFRE